jgi:hypothetical protein
VTRAALTLLLLAASGPVAAQSPAAPPPAPPPAAAPAPLPPERNPAGAGSLNLNLQLDDASRRRIMSGAIEEGGRGGKDLPTLGGDARKLDPSEARSSPYPKQYNDTPALQ